MTYIIALPKFTYFFLQGKTSFRWMLLTPSIPPKIQGKNECSLLHWYLGNRDHWKNLNTKQASTYKNLTYNKISTTNYTHGFLFGLWYEQYFVQISAAIKEIFYARYITGKVQGALNAHTVHIVLSLSVCVNVVPTASLLYGEWPLMQYTLQVYNCGFKVMWECSSWDPCVWFVVSVV